MSDPAPLISIIIPAYNQVRYLRQSIDSALAQSVPHFEIIVVDDGSTDETAAIAKSYGDKIRYIYQDNLGLAGARNTGIRAANGKHVAFLDADDIWLPDYLEVIQILINQHPDASLYFAVHNVSMTKAINCHNKLAHRNWIHRQSKRCTRLC